jgi:uncharacterized protein
MKGYMVFSAILTSFFSLILLYVFWRASAAPVFKHVSRHVFIGSYIGVLLVFSLGRYLAYSGSDVISIIFEYVGMALLGWVFITFTLLFLVDVLTIFGLLFSKWIPSARIWALSLGLMFSVFALIQAVRSPEVLTHEVAMKGLPKSLNDKVLVAVSDAHLGSLLGQEWFNERIEQINELKPDILVFVGDMFEAHGVMFSELSSLRELKVPLGKWYVEGNHEAFGRAELSRKLLDDAGFRHLKNTSVEVTDGLIIAGVDDLSMALRRSDNKDYLSMALEGRPEGATILLSHSPLQVDKAASFGVELMLSGHTHAGQIWPFGYFVKMVYPIVSGRYEIDGMTAIVSRGVGTWGPRMRLWQRSDILKIVLKSEQG